MNSISDQELIMLLREQNEDAEKILYERYFKIIGKIIKEYKKTLSELNIDESNLFANCLDTFYYALNNYSNLSDASFNTYVKLLINRAIKKEIIKKININNHVTYISLTEYEEKNHEVSDKKIKDNLERICDEEDIQQINKIILDKLNEKELTSLVLLLQGYSYHDISKILHKSYNQVYYQISLIKKKIMQEIKKNSAKSLAFSK